MASENIIMAMVKDGGADRQVNYLFCYKNGDSFFHIKDRQVMP